MRQTHSTRYNCRIQFYHINAINSGQKSGSASRETASGAEMRA